MTSRADERDDLVDRITRMFFGEGQAPRNTMEIARAFHMKEHVIFNLLPFAHAVHRLNAHLKLEPRRRHCMACQQIFQSQHRGHRLCNMCRVLANEHIHEAPHV